jgi:hypothetical protein
MTTYKLTIESGKVSSYETFARRYTLTVIKETEKGSVVNLHAIDITPSGHPSGGTESRLLQNELVKFKDTEVNKNIAKLAVRFDPKLLQVQSHDKGIHIIRDQLNKKANEKVKVIEV